MGRDLEHFFTASFARFARSLGDADLIRAEVSQDVSIGFLVPLVDAHCLVSYIAT